MSRPMASIRTPPRRYSAKYTSSLKSSSHPNGCTSKSASTVSLGRLVGLVTSTAYPLTLAGWT
eukprot:1722213-Alexandrium_andersonii.AAC.1